jgi:repressor LexA
MRFFPDQPATFARSSYFGYSEIKVKLDFGKSELYDPRNSRKGGAMLDIRMIERGLEKPGKTKGGLADAMNVRPGAVSEILSGLRLIKASEIADIIDYLELNSVPIMGRVGAGAAIEPEHEQVPPEGLGEVELPFPIAEETIAFEVSGDSMLPKYENGDVIVVFRQQRHPISSFYGEEAAVRLKSGERYLKTVERGKSASLVNLTSFNAKPIVGVKLEWIGEICVTLPRGQIDRLRARAAGRARKAARANAGAPREK